MLTNQNVTVTIKSNVEYKILNKNNEEINETTKIGTGMKIQFVTGESYEIVVAGDVNGDGKISTTDLTKMKKHIIQRELLQGCYGKAADVKEDKKISVTDLARMKKVLVGLIAL